MTTATAASIPDHGAGHSHHPNYVAIFIWLVILTFIEVSIPELVHIKGVGHDPMTPSVLAPDAYQGEDVDPALQEAARAMAPTERFQTSGWAMRIGVLAVLAVVKAAMVGAYFMHLRFDGWKLNAMLAVPTALFAFIIIMLTPDVAWQWPKIY